MLGFQGSIFTDLDLKYAWISSVPLSSADSRRVSPSQMLLSSLDMQGEALENVHHIRLEQPKELKQTEIISAAQKTGDYWSLLHFYILPRKRAFLLS